MRNAAINAVSTVDLDATWHTIEALQATLDDLLNALGAGSKGNRVRPAKRRRAAA
jgi:hypothetical protein